jgi:hypothetical protein
MMSPVKIKGRIVHAVVNLVIVAEFGKGQPIRPIVLVIVYEGAKVLFNLLVYAFGLAIRLRVISCGGVCPNSKEVVQSLHESGNEDASPVIDDRFRKAKIFPDVIPEESRHSFR